jgi:hypothetical protein
MLNKNNSVRISKIALKMIGMNLKHLHRWRSDVLKFVLINDP